MLANEVGVGSLLCFRPCLSSGMHSDRITECSHVHLTPSQAQSSLVGCWCLVKLGRIVKHQSGSPLMSQGCFGLSHCASPHEYCVLVSTTRPIHKSLVTLQNHPVIIGGIISPSLHIKYLNLLEVQGLSHGHTVKN